MDTFKNKISRFLINIGVFIILLPLLIGFLLYMLVVTIITYIEKLWDYLVGER
jgi:hypothetical protein